NEALGIFHEHHLSYKEVVKRDKFVRIDIRVALLLMWKVDIQTYRLSFCLVRTAVSGLHDTGATACNDSVSVLDQLVSNFLCDLVISIAWPYPGLTKNGNTRSNLGKFFKAFNKLRHRLKAHPAVGTFKLGPILVFKCLSDLLFFFQFL